MLTGRAGRGEAVVEERPLEYDVDQRVEEMPDVDEARARCGSGGKDAKRQLVCQDTGCNKEEEGPDCGLADYWLCFGSGGGHFGRR